MDARATARARSRRPVPLPFLLPLLLLLLSLADHHRSVSLAFASPPPIASASSSSSSWGLGTLWRSMGRSSSTSRLFAGVEPDEPVPFSSRQMSAVRALEAERPADDRLFSDPLSAHFAGEEAMRQARERANASRASQGVGRKIAVRTRFFDDFLVDCCSDAKPPRRRLNWLRAFFFSLNWLLRRRHRPPRPIKQVLILGCGMDTRAWRLPLHDTVVVEVDVAPVLRAKASVLRAVQAERRRAGQPELPLRVRERRSVPADLADPDDDWPARVAGVLDIAQPVAVILEGLLMYLGEGEVRALLARAGALAAAPGSRVGISLVDRRSVHDARASASALRRTWKWGCDEEECRAFFAGALSGGGGEGVGWAVTHVTKVGSKGGYPGGANYGCWDNVGKWRRVGKTLYVLAERTGGEGRGKGSVQQKKVK